MINYDLFKSIEKYAIEHTESSIELYKSRNQNINNIMLNCLRGKLAEFSCYLSMKKAGYILENEPDLKIMNSSKSYDADLVCIGKNKIIYDKPKYIHVKSISKDSYDKFGASFLIEKNDPITKMKSDNHFYSIMIQKSLAEYNFHKWICINDVVYQKPKMNLPTKFAVYL